MSDKLKMPREWEIAFYTTLTLITVLCWYSIVKPKAEASS